MANIKVSEMLEATSFEDGDYAMIVQGRSSKKISRTNMLKNQNGILLWKNSSPDIEASSFSMNLFDDYDCYEIIYKKAKDSEIYCSTGKILKGKSVNLISWNGIEEAGSYLEIRWRNFNYTDEYHGYISNCQTKQANATQKGVNNDAVIPLYIIGYKAELFD